MSTSKQARTRGEDYQAPTPVPKAKRTRGRPSEYGEDKLRQACLVARLGGTDTEIAEVTGVSTATVYNWYNQFPEFLEAVRTSKDTQNQRVVRSLFQRANGYTYQSEKVFSNGLRATVHEHVPADVGAALNWLYNRDPERWKKTGEMSIVVPVDDAAPAKLDSRVNALAALALFNEAAYDPTLDAAGPLLEMTANAEEQDDGEARSFSSGREPVADKAYDPDFDDLDPGEV